MSTFVFSTYGARGDLFPYLAIARELQNRGHRAIVATSENYRAEIEGLGVEFRAVRPDAPRGADLQKMMHPIGGSEWLFRRWLLPHLRQSIADLDAICQNADVLISHTTSLAGPIVAQLPRNRSLKWVSSAVSPLALLQNDAALPALPRAADFPILNRALLGILRRQFGMNLKETQKIRAELGIARGENALWSDAHSPQLQLALWNEKFAPLAPDSPRNSPRKATGFCFLESQNSLAPAIETFLRQGEAPLVFVAASFSQSSRWEEESEDAARRIGKRAILLGARQNSVSDSETDSVSDSILRCEFAPLDAILPRALALIHAGGIGTLALGFRAQAPMLLAPRAHDQFDNARRAVKSRLAHFKKRGNLAPQIGALLGDETLKSRLESARDEWANGAARAADELEI